MKCLMMFFLPFLIYSFSGCCTGAIWIPDDQKPSRTEKDCISKKEFTPSQDDLFFYFEGIGENKFLSKAKDIADEDIRRSLFTSVLTELGSKSHFFESHRRRINECIITVHGFTPVSECMISKTSYWKSQCKKNLNTTRTDHKFILVKRLSKAEYRRVVLKVQNCLNQP